MRTEQEIRDRIEDNNIKMRFDGLYIRPGIENDVLKWVLSDSQ